MVRRIIIFLLFFALLAPTITVYSTDENTVPEEYEDWLDSIPDDITDLLPEDIFSSNLENIASGSKKLTNWNYIISYIFNIIGINFKVVIKAFATLMALLILCSLLKTFNSTIKSSALDNVIGLIGNIAVISSLMEISKEPILNGCWDKLCMPLP